MKLRRIKAVQNKGVSFFGLPCRPHVKCSQPATKCQKVRWAHRRRSKAYSKEFFGLHNIATFFPPSHLAYPFTFLSFPPSPFLSFP